MAAATTAVELLLIRSADSVVESFGPTDSIGLMLNFMSSGPNVATSLGCVLLPS